MEPLLKPESSTGDEAGDEPTLPRLPDVEGATALLWPVGGPGMFGN